MGGETVGLMLVSEDGDIVRLQALGRLSGSGPSNEIDPIRSLAGMNAYARKVLLDLEQVEFVDSAAIGWLLACHKRFAKAGGILVIHSVPEELLLTFTMLRLHSIFHFAADDETAEKFASEAGNPGI